MASDDVIDPPSLTYMDVGRAQFQFQLATPRGGVVPGTLHSSTPRQGAAAVALPAGECKNVWEEMGADCVHAVDGAAVDGAMGIHGAGGGQELPGERWSM